MTSARCIQKGGKYGWRTFTKRRETDRGFYRKSQNRAGNRAKIVVYTQIRHILAGSLRGIKNQSVNTVWPTCI